MNRHAFSSRLSSLSAFVSLLALAACSDDAPTSDQPIITAGFGGAAGKAGSTSTGGAGQSGKAGTSGSSGASGQSGAGQGGAGQGGKAGGSGTAGSAGQSGDGGTGGTDAGAAGDSGAAGEAGAGVSGSSGQSGAAGDTGNGGFAGDVGVAGAAGDAGNGGFAGDVGVAGAAGDAGAAGNATGGSDSAGGQGGAAGQSGSSGQGGAAAGQSGSSGQSSGGTSAGTAGAGGGLAGGAAGTAGTGGSSGSSGQTAGGASGAGAGGSAGGAAGAGGSGAGGSASSGARLVAVIDRGQTAAAALSYSPTSGWTASADLSLASSSSSLAPYKGGAVAMVRRASATSSEQNELFWATWTASTGFTTFAKVGTFGFAKEGPSIAGNGTVVEATYVGTDTNDYTTQLNELGTFAPFAAFPGGQVGSQASSQRAIDLSAIGAATWAAYAGNDGGLYYTSKAGPGSTWAFSAKAPTGLLSPTIAPDVQAFDGGVTVAYVLSSNSRIALNTLTVPQNAWGTEETIGESVITGSSPALLRLGANDYLVVWHGFNDQGIYFSRGGAGTWSTPKAIHATSGDTVSAPVVLAGVGTGRAEVLFTRSGVLRHARYDGSSFITNDVPTTSNGVSVAATIVPAP